MDRQRATSSIAQPTSSIAQPTSLSSVYSYAPLASSLEYLFTKSSNPPGSSERRVSITTHSIGVIGAACRKSGFLGLRYVEETTAQEFVRFCHRDLAGAVIMFVWLVGILTPSFAFHFLASTPVGHYNKLLVVTQVLALAVELSVHCWARNGERFTYRVARLRHIAHNASAIAIMSLGLWTMRHLVLECHTDDEFYEPVHGHEASSRSRYHFCVRSASSPQLFMLILGLFTLNLNVYVYWFLTNVAAALVAIGLLFVEYPENTTLGLVWATKTTEIVVRILVVFVCAQVSTLAAAAKQRSLQRGFEAALEVHYQTHASKQRLDSVDSLLCSMLPPSALQRLMADTKVLDATSEGTVFFSDMVQFTPWSSVRTPRQVVAMLSVLIRAFDILAADMEVDKVKTIGDCYWAVTGIPSQTERHAEVMVNFGLAFVDLTRKQSRKYSSWDYPEVASAPPQQQERRPIEFRVGIHSGPVLGGVLGSQQISYEVFGETSDIANWVEQKGKPMHVVVSGQTKRCLQSQLCGAASTFDFSPYGTEAEMEDSDESLFDWDAAKEGQEDTQEDGDLNLILSGEPSSLPKLYLVTPHQMEGNVSMERRSSGHSSHTQSDQVIPRAEGEQESETAAARAERRRFVESHLLVRGSRTTENCGAGESELSQATFEGLMEQYATRKYACAVYTFADPTIEAGFRRFVVSELMDFRLGGAVAMLGTLLILFVFILVDAAGDPSALCLCLIIASLLLLCSATVLLFQKRTALRAPTLVGTEMTEADSSTSHKYLDLEFGLTQAGAACWLLACFFGPDSVLTNEPDYLLGLFFLLLSLPSLHLPSLSIMGANMVLIIICYTDMALRGPTVVVPVTILPLIVLWFTMVSVMLETRLRVQFLESKAANHFAAQQQLAIRAQEAVLRSIVPDFVIAPLMAWLASDFDPLKTVVQNFDEVCVAFMRLSPPSNLTPANSTSRATSPPLPAEESAEWLYRGHLAVDEVLVQSSVIDKVKTVGDVLMVAGSFRGHSSQEAAFEMLRVAVIIHQRFRLGDSSDQSSVTIGLHAGPVMGIVLGYSRLAFDIFGDTVNTTSRVMASPVAKQAIAASTSFTDLLPKSSSLSLERPGEGPRKSDAPTITLSSKGSPAPTVAWQKVEEGASGTGETSLEYGPPCEVAAKGKGTLEVRRIVQKSERKA